MKRFATVCSGIGAPEVAAQPLGWESVFGADNEPFPNAVRAHHFPSVPNLGDMTQFSTWPKYAIDVLIGGTPCQAFSVAGLRKGLADPRGNLTLTFLGIVDRYRPQWVLWENVPGVLSIDGGRTFGAFLGGLGKLGYGCSYRILDAQYFGVAQRRRRVFVVGHIGGLWQRAAAVLFERESLRGDSAPRRETGKGIAPTISARTKGGGGLGADAECDRAVIPIQEIGKRQSGTPMNGVGYGAPGDPMYTLQSGAQRGVAQPMTLAIRGRGDSSDLETRQDGLANAIMTPNGGPGGVGVGAVAHILKADGFDASEDGTGRGVPLVAAPVTTKAYADNDGQGAKLIHEIVSQAMSSKWSKGSSGPAGDEVANMIPVSGPSMAVRRLTPRECERLQGFPDDFTLVNFRGKPAADGPRYKALGNSMAVPNIRWILRRLDFVDQLSPFLKS